MESCMYKSHIQLEVSDYTVLARDVEERATLLDRGSGDGGHSRQHRSAAVDDASCLQRDSQKGGSCDLHGLTGYPDPPAGNRCLSSCLLQDYPGVHSVARSPEEHRAVRDRWIT